MRFSPRPTLPGTGLISGRKNSRTPNGRSDDWWSLVIPGSAPRKAGPDTFRHSLNGVGSSASDRATRDALAAGRGNCGDDFHFTKTKHGACRCIRDLVDDGSTRWVMRAVILHRTGPNFGLHVGLKHPLAPTSGDDRKEREHRDKQSSPRRKGGRDTLLRCVTAGETAQISPADTGVDPD